MLKITTLNPSDIIPIEAPHKPESVAFFQNIYSDPSFQDHLGHLDNVVPYAFVHRAKDGLIYTMDGHHRIAVAHMHGKDVNSIFINTFKDWADVCVLKDMRFIPPFETVFDVQDLPHLVRKLIEYRAYAQMRGVNTFDDFVQQIKDGIFWKYDISEQSVFVNAFISSVTDGVPDISFISEGNVNGAIYQCNELSRPSYRRLKQVYGIFSKEDRATLTSRKSTTADFEKLREKYSNRPDAIDIINAYDPNHPLYEAKMAKIRKIARGTHEDIIKATSENQ